MFVSSSWKRALRGLVVAFFFVCSVAVAQTTPLAPGLEVVAEQSPATPVTLPSLMSLAQSLALANARHPDFLARFASSETVPEQMMLNWLKRELKRSFQDVLNSVKRPVEDFPVEDFPVED